MNQYVQAAAGLIAGAITLYLLDQAVQRHYQQRAGGLGTNSSRSPAPAPKPSAVKKARTAAGLAIRKGSWSLSGVVRSAGAKVAKKVGGG